MRPYTPSELRTLACSRLTNPFFVTQVAAALNYSADALEAADKALQAELARSQQSAAMPEFPSAGYLDKHGQFFADPLDVREGDAVLVHLSDVAAAWPKAINPNGGAT